MEEIADPTGSIQRSPQGSEEQVVVEGVAPILVWKDLQVVTVKHKVCFYFIVIRSNEANE
jgi:hypothetical protein